MTASKLVSSMSGPDHRLMRRVQRWKPPRIVRLWALWATRAGDGWLWGLCGLVALLFGGPERFHAVLAGLLAVGSGIALFQALKNGVRRRRPCQIEPHCWITLAPPDQFSFPSGHTITAFAVALTLGSYYPAALAILVFCAISIGISRILLGMHFLTDVLAGCAIGILLAWLAVHLVGRVY